LIRDGGGDAINELAAARKIVVRDLDGKRSA
jgi:hypothetical protein